MNIFLDIETLPTADPLLCDAIAEGISPPKTLKKAESIATWEIEEKPAVVAEAIGRTALDGTYGRVCAFGLAMDEGDVITFVGHEPETLEKLFSIIESCQYEKTGHTESMRDLIFCGHNILGFDLRFLWQRAVINGIRCPVSLRRAAFAKPWDKNIGDTMTMWHPDRDRRISLDRLCRVLGVPSPKGDMDGSKVAAAFAAGEWERIELYVGADVTAQRACFQRLRAA